MALLMNGTMETMLPCKLRGADPAANRSCFARGLDVIGPHHFTTAWTEKIPNASTKMWVLPMKIAVTPTGAPTVRRLLTLVGAGQ